MLKNQRKVNFWAHTKLCVAFTLIPVASALEPMEGQCDIWVIRADLPQVFPCIHLSTSPNRKAKQLRNQTSSRKQTYSYIGGTDSVFTVARSQHIHLVATHKLFPLRAAWWSTLKPLLLRSVTSRCGQLPSSSRISTLSLPIASCSAVSP